MQMIMVSYSDSDKDAGLASARWSLQQAQSCLVRTLDEQQVDFNLFHGRGGTISRGGGRTHAAVLGSPAGVIRGRLRATEQGELVNTKFGVRAIALRTLEQTTAAVAKATALPRKESPKERSGSRAYCAVVSAKEESMLESWYGMYRYMKEREREFDREAELRRLRAQVPKPCSRNGATDSLTARLGRLLMRWGMALQRQHRGSIS